MDTHHQPRFLDPAHSHPGIDFERRHKPRRRLTLLVVDDERFIRDFLAIGLLCHGFDVKTASDGYEAVEICKASPVEVTLVDGMNGSETITAIGLVAPGVRCCMMSGDVGQCQARNVGTTVMAKPFKLDEIARELRRLVELPLGCVD